MVQFDKPREEINELLNEMTAIVESLMIILESEDGNGSMNHNLFRDFLKLMLEKINNYKFTLMRDYLKCVFVGRTSNGKSTLVNALLNQYDLPMGIGHTTNCCIMIHSCEKNEAYIEHFGPNNLNTPIAIFSIDKLNSISHALSKQKISSQDSLRVNYPENLCRIIKSNVYVVDSPGIDIETDFDEWIDKYCLDADLFVLVCNAESILMQCEKNFFFKVKKNFLLPNVIVVNNRWDASIEQPIEHVNKVKKQQMDTFSDFLTKELKVCKESEVKARVFFIAAHEEMKLQRDHENLDNIPRREEREEDFQRLIKTLEKYLSPDALNQKLTANFLGMEKIFGELNSFINCLFNTIIIEKDLLKRNLAEQMQFYKKMENAIPTLHQQALVCIDDIVKQAKDKITYDFKNLVCDLDLSTNTINVVFNPYNRKEYLDYQKFLVENIETLLLQDLNTRTVTGLNFLLKNGFEKLTMIYSEALLIKYPCEQQKLPPVSSCQPPIPELYPEFNPIMNKKISNMKSKIRPIPNHFMSANQCSEYLETVDNRFITYSKGQVDNTVSTGSVIVVPTNSKLPEVTLMVPKFSTVVMTDFTFSPGFQFTLSPSNISSFWTQWSQSPCSVRSRLRLISWKSIGFCSTCGGILYVVIYLKGKLWRQGLLFVIGLYCSILAYEKHFWNVNMEMISLKDQFINHSKVKMESIIHISAVTTARQLGSFLHMDLKGLEEGVENIINDFHVQIEKLGELEGNIISNEKKVKKIKSSMYLISQQILAFKKNIFDPKYGIVNSRT